MEASSHLRIVGQSGSVPFRLILEVLVVLIVLLLCIHKIFIDDVIELQSLS